METEITVEVFNKCEGSCTGCMLSLIERKQELPAMSPDIFEQIISKLVSYGQKIETNYRPVFVFGDFPSMDIEFQEKFLNTIKSHNLHFGTTLTLVDKSKKEQYARSIDMILETDDNVILDFTVDPFRMEKDDDYTDILAKYIKYSPKFHLQVLLSEALLNRYSPEELSSLLSERFGEVPVTLGFTPTLTNLDKKNYRFDVGSAAEYTKRFFATNYTLQKHLKSELSRFHSEGEYQDFLSHGFHIGSDSTLYPVTYTIFGDVILDRRNGGSGFGKISQNNIENILSEENTKMQMLSKQNSIYMNHGEFDCDSCDFYDSCKFHGVGLIRKKFKGYENKTGSCYGPVTMVA
jgi:hypothetical protein